MNREERLERFVNHSKEFQEVLSTIPEAHRYTSVNGGWSAAFVMHHMTDGELHFTSRFLHAIGDEKPTIQMFDEEIYPERLNYSKRKLKTSLATFVGNRALALDILSNASEADWAKVSIHPELGEVTLLDLFEREDRHILNHIQQLKDISSQFQ